MYDLLPVFFGVVMLGLGLFMALNPKGATKEELRDNEAEVAKIKRNGFIIIGCGIVAIVIGILL